MLKFEEKTHTYTYNGQIAHSVTTILREWLDVEISGTAYKVNAFTGKAVLAQMFKDAADHGNAVHNAIAYYLTCGIDMEALHEDVHRALNMFIEWFDEHVDEVIEVEKPLYSKAYHYAGTADLIRKPKRKYGGKRAVIDYKTGAFGLAGPQLAAYETQHREDSGYKGKIERYVLKLPKVGDKYKFTKEEGRQDWAFFRNRLFTFNFIKGRK